ncbi:MAG: RimK family alpha-L-glutamate ligase [Clostridia bacterium]|nr:RimK family alpha-L-glutamate ligase [Clostridia bacterium]
MKQTNYTGWLIVNRFLQTTKFNEIYEYLKQAASKQNCLLSLVTNTDLIPYANQNSCLYSASDLPAPDFILFWDKDIHLAHRLESMGHRLFNCADAIEICDNKALTFSKLSAASDIRMPMTIIAPMTYETVGYKTFSFLAPIEDCLSYPIVIKECYGSFGAQVYLANNREEVIAILKKCQGKQLIFQEFIKSSYGHDLRINMVGDAPVASMLRHNPDDFRANITNGGSMTSYSPTPDQIKLAKAVCRRLNLSFAGVDILFGPDQEPILCEVNSNAHFKNIYQCTGINVADRIIEYILQELSAS